METFLFLAIGLVVGAVIGWLIANARKSASTPESQEQALLIQAAGLQAQIAGLEAQLVQARNEKIARDERDREENKLLQALAPVKVHLEQMQGVVTRLERERTEQFGSIQ